MTPSDQKELAKWAAEFLGWSNDDSDDYWEVPDGIPNWLPNVEYKGSNLPNLFFHPTYMDNEAPILMHLAQVEMEKRGFHLEFNKFTSQGYQWWMHKAEPMPDVNLGDKVLTEYFERCEPKWQKHENEFIAGWLAIRSAIENENTN